MPMLLVRKANARRVQGGLTYVPTVRVKIPKQIMKMFIRNPIQPRMPLFFQKPGPRSALLILMYATPQKIQPKKESKRELISESKSAKKGMTSAMMKAATHVRARMPAHDAQPTTV